MTYQRPDPNRLIDLLARQWTLDSTPESAVFSHNSAIAAIPYNNGTLHLIATKDSDSATVRLRRAGDTGRQTIRPRKSEIAPVVKAACSELRSSAVVACGKSNFLFGTENGQLSLVTPQGEETLLETGMNKPVVAVATRPIGSELCFAAGREVVVCEDKNLNSQRRFQLTGPTTALAYSPDGSALAVACETGISVWDLSAEPILKHEYPLKETPRGIDWSANGLWLAGSLADCGAVLVNVQNHQVRLFSDFATDVNAVSFSSVANAIAIPGAYRAAAWSLAELRKQEDTNKAAIKSGRPGLVLVDSLAACPTRNILAVGYANGLLNLTQIGGEEEMVLDQDTGVSVSSLSWDSTGKYLAIGRADGKVALAEFPPGLFK